MISGYIRSKQELVDLLTGCLSSKAGTLDLFLGMKVVSLYLKDGFIAGFRFTDVEENIPQNKKSWLLYHLSEFMENPQAFFAFREEKAENLIELDEPVLPDELVLQLQVVNSELRLLIDKVITPMAVVKVVKEFDNYAFYEGKSIYQILVNSKSTILEEIRRLIDLFSGGYLDISQFQNAEFPGEEARIEYLMSKVNLEKVNLVNLLENLQLSGFSGLVQIKGEDFHYDMCYKKGALTAVYPCNPEIFDLLLMPKKGAIYNVVNISENILDLLMLKNLRERVVNRLSGSFIEMGKMHVGMNMEGKSGLIIAHLEDKDIHLLYRNGSLVGIIEEEKSTLKCVKSLPVNKVDWVDVVFYQPIDNIRNVVHLFLLNLVYGILLKYAAHLSQVIAAKLASLDTLKYHEGSILCRKMQINDEEVFGFLHFLLDLSYDLLGKEKLEKELETVLEPYKDVLKILKVEEYLVLPEL